MSQLDIQTVIRVLLVVEIPFYRDGLQRLLSQDPGILVLDPVAGIQAVAAATRERPDLVLLDINPPGARGWIDELCSLPQPPRIVALAVDDAEESLLRWLEAGISGYVSRHSSYAELVHVLRCAVRGEWSCSPQVMSLVIRRLSTLSSCSRSLTPASPSLTAREAEILDLVGRGLSNKRIAMILNISHATAKNHVHHILSKLQLSSRAEVAAYLNRRAPVATDLKSSIETRT